jgi:hypothetical protein
VSNSDTSNSQNQLVPYKSPLRRRLEVTAGVTAGILAGVSYRRLTHDHGTDLIPNLLSLCVLYIAAATFVRLPRQPASYISSADQIRQYWSELAGPFAFLRFAEISIAYAIMFAGQLWLFFGTIPMFGGPLATAMFLVLPGALVGIIRFATAVQKKKGKIEPTAPSTHWIRNLLAGYACYTLGIAAGITSSRYVPESWRLLTMFLGFGAGLVGGQLVTAKMPELQRPLRTGKLLLVLMLIGILRFGVPLSAFILALVISSGHRHFANVQSIVTVSVRMFGAFVVAAVGSGAFFGAAMWLLACIGKLRRRTPAVMTNDT